MGLARRLSHTRRAAWRLGLANLHRAGAPTPLVLGSLGIGLITLTAIAQIECNPRCYGGLGLPTRAPNFCVLDIQPDQVARFDALVAGLPGIEEVRRVPKLRFFFQAEDGIRDGTVTGVQTCALPI